jgi:polyphosphate glucokinase
MPASSKKITLAIDIGGTGVKAMLLDERGKRLSERLRADTPVPATPAAVLKVIDGLTAQLGTYDRASVGFPGVVKHGITMTAHNLHPKWVGYEMEKVLSTRLGIPVRIANDAAVQGYGAIKGEGLELVITLGTGFGSALFTDGHLAPGLELAHHPWRKNKTYEDYLGRRGLKARGRKKWNEDLQAAIEQIEALFNYDHMYVGGGNAVKIDFPLPKNVSRVPNEDGLLGGAALWRFDTRPTSREKANVAQDGNDNDR